MKEKKWKIEVDIAKCDFCGTCVAVCETDSIEMDETNIQITDRCTLCLKCLMVCPLRAMSKERIVG